MNSTTREAIRKVAKKIHADVTSATSEDAKKLARAVLLLLGEKL
jgi:hypothetical protein